MFMKINTAAHTTISSTFGFRTLPHRKVFGLRISAFGFRPAVLCMFSAFPIVLNATTNLNSTLQQALFEEEANNNLTAAIQSYQSLVTQFDQDRKLAATAIFR